MNRCTLALLLCIAGGGSAAPLQAADQDRPFGIPQRIPWTTSRVIGSADPPSPYQAECVFPQLSFKEPVDLCLMPGTDRLVMAELGGKIFSFRNSAEPKQPDLFIDLRKEIPGMEQLYGITFHPRFRENRFVYLCYVLKPDLPEGSRVSRFKVTETDPPRIDPASETIIITWLSGGHNGGCLKFGPDGYLYISTGDGVGPNPPDTRNTGQDLNDLLSTIVRIDVDHFDGDNAYRIPPDNPFVNYPGGRGEIWAYGFRNPWKMSFDAKTGDLWVGDVGWELWELIYRVERGGNYGWSVMEGRQPIRTDLKPGPTPIRPPVVDHPHSEAASITGGFIYYGKKLEMLHGAYVYGDYETGKIWALRYDGKKVAWHRELVDTPLKIITFSETPDGELYFVDYGGMMYQLAPNPDAGVASPFPRKLSQTGLFSSLNPLQPAPGVVAYSVNAELWHDQAQAYRYLALPGESSIEIREEKWIFPTNAVLVKMLSVPWPADKNLDARYWLETQLLHYDGSHWRAYAYAWHEDQSDADLVDANGGQRSFTLTDSNSNQAKTARRWRFASRAECLRCHNSWSGPALAWNPLQLNKEHQYGTVRDHQLRTLAQAHYLNRPLEPEKLPKLASPEDATAPLLERGRSYLHANCAHCHRMHAGGAVLSQMNYEVDLAKALLIGYRPSQGSFGMKDSAVVYPGDPYRSVLYYRLAKSGRGRMPLMGSDVHDDMGLELMFQWIRSLPPNLLTNAPSEPAPHSMKITEPALRQLGVSNDPRPTDALNQLLSDTSGALALQHAVARKQLPDSLAQLAIETGSAHPDSKIRDLFERFIPEEKRLQKLGPHPELQTILRLPGNPANGRQIFFENEGLQCKNCHRVQGPGADFGPDLSGIGGKYDRRQLLEHLLAPSKTIDPAFAGYSAETKDGQVYSGFLIERTPVQVVLKTLTQPRVAIPQSDIVSVIPLRLSLMPDFLLQDLTPQQAADLVEYLHSLK